MNFSQAEIWFIIVALGIAAVGVGAARQWSWSQQLDALDGLGASLAQLSRESDRSLALEVVDLHVAEHRIDRGGLARILDERADLQLEAERMAQRRAEQIARQKAKQQARERAEREPDDGPARPVGDEDDLDVPEITHDDVVKAALPDRPVSSDLDRLRHSVHTLLDLPPEILDERSPGLSWLTYELGSIIALCDGQATLDHARHTVSVKEPAPRALPVLKFVRIYLLQRLYARGGTGRIQALAAMRDRPTDLLMTDKVIRSITETESAEERLVALETAAATLDSWGDAARERLGNAIGELRVADGSELQTPIDDLQRRLSNEPPHR